VKDWWYNYWPGVVVLGFILVMCSVISLLDRIACQNKWQASGWETKWSLTTSCLISKDGKVWIPADAYRVVE
jgi:hypothetical protein